MVIAHGRIYEHYKREGYLSVPGYYEKGKDNHCKLCGWENRSTAGHCQNCGDRYARENRAGKIVAGIPVRALWPEEWQVFQIIAMQIMDGKVPFATVEEYAAECQARLEEDESLREAEALKQQKFDAILNKK